MAWGQVFRGGDMSRLAYGLCLAAMLGLLAFMNAVTLPRIAAEAGGLTAFDLRATGYSEAEARAFLTALSPEGRALYSGLQHRLDTAYPPLLALVLVWTYMVLLPKRWAVAASLLAVLGAGVDLVENARVAALLRPETPTAEEIASASWATLAKTGVVSLALAALGLTLGMAALRRLRAG